jgi:hypothetical protein
MIRMERIVSLKKEENERKVGPGSMTTNIGLHLNFVTAWKNACDHYKTFSLVFVKYGGT